MRVPLKRRNLSLGLLLILMACARLTAEDAGDESLIDLDALLLPEAWREKLSIGTEIRYRFDHWDNFDFDDTKDDVDGFHLLRSRLNIDYDVFTYLRTFWQMQDARIWGAEFTGKALFRDNFDIRQGYVDVRNLLGGALTFRVGRQELAYGDERLIGPSDWSNIPRSFDALKIMYEVEKFKVDLFASRVVAVNRRSFNEWDHKDNFFGLYATVKPMSNHLLDLYYLLRDTEKDIRFGPTVGAAEEEESTIGLRLAGREIKGFDYTIESAFQFGDFGDEDIRAYALITAVGYTFDVFASPRIGFEWDLGSGERDPNDNVRNTFDTLFPSAHPHYGYMDRASLQNLNNVRFTISTTPMPKLSFQTDLHIMHIDKTTDSFYGAARRPVRTAAVPDVSDYVGSELDLTLKYTLNKNLNVLVGYSHFFAGKFLKETGRGDDADYFYVQTLLNF